MMLKKYDWLTRHLLYAFLIRLTLVLYGEWHDENFLVKYTDIDYRVFSDAAKYVAEGKSPFLRSTYRYTPLLAWLLVGNITIHPIFGKILFILGDILSGYLIHQILVSFKTMNSQIRFACVVWLYNPLTMVISTRGSADSLVTCMVLGTLHLLEMKKTIYAGIMYGLAVHFKLYPITYCIPLYFSLVSEDSSLKNKKKQTMDENLANCIENSNHRNCKNIIKKTEGSLSNSVFIQNTIYFIWPNSKRILFVISCLVTLTFLTVICYYLYGAPFINEGFIYHVYRKDTRHNFSVYFYMLYLTSEWKGSLVLSIVSFLPQAFLLIALAFRFHRRKDLPFCLFAQTYVFVSLNKVCTSQYFVWYVSLLPLVLPRLKLMTIGRVIGMASAWTVSQAAWLYFAFRLEFKGDNTFFEIWAAGLGFYIVNIAVLVQLITCYR